MIRWKEYLGPLSWGAAGLCALLTVLAIVEERGAWIVVFGAATASLLARQWRARKQV